MQKLVKSEKEKKFRDRVGGRGICSCGSLLWLVTDAWLNHNDPLPTAFGRLVHNPGRQQQA
ncbi:hypothetical protein T4E_10766 [Trichinella pseudospiralis]|uniref:Uncharacterized protein n=1 Tax=Trichinella pseudospiralis TaxID=6337 RepID=A0A0V0XSH1_TRIPS|nr:hypothetical protein T4E_10766 [Trichinella pseudospiralis]